MADDDITGSGQAAQNTANALEALANGANNSGERLNGLGAIAAGAKDIFSNFSKTLESYNMSLKDSGAFTNQQSVAFAALATTALETRKAFDNLTGVDYSNISGFTEQFSTLKKIIGDSPVYNTTEKQMSAISKSLVSLGVPMDKIQEAAKGGLSGLIAYGAGFLQSADNALRLQSAIIQLAGKTGSLNEIFNVAGEDLGNVNSLLAQQNKIIGDSISATGLNEQKIESYYAMLGGVRGALNENVKATEQSEKNTNMLTASIKLAMGTGQRYEEVISDLRVAFREYGIVGENALKLNARFSELSNKFGIELDDVRSGLMGAAGAFKIFADAGDAASKMSENLAGIMNDYVQSLKGTGMSGLQAVKVVQDMTSSVAGLNVAQKAFLSAQTGGPGGLMGAFQIEKMLKSGDIEGVFNKVQQTMQKQFGKIVTLDEASTSQAAASQLQKQMLLLQKGPLGGMVKSDQDAYRLLEAMRNKQEGRITSDQAASPLRDDIVQQSMDRGTAIQEKSYTTLTEANVNLQAIRRAADVLALDTIQKGMTAGTGSANFLGTDTNPQQMMRAGLKEFMSNVSQQGGEANRDYKAQLAGEMPIKEEAAGAAAATSINNMDGFTDQIVNTFDSMKDLFGQLFDQKTENPTVAYNNLAMTTQQAIEAQPTRTSGQMVREAPRMVPSPTTAGPATTQTMVPDVRVNKSGDMGRVTVQVDVKVIEDGNQSIAITPAAR
jgi:hypothetical protein